MVQIFPHLTSQDLYISVTKGKGSLHGVELVENIKN